MIIRGGFALKKIIFTLFPLISIIILVSMIQHKILHNTKLEESIHSIVKEEKKDVIDINSLTEFTWDKAFIFYPYTQQETINEQLGVYFRDRSNIDRRDDIYLVVFLNDGKVVHYAEIKRQSEFYWPQPYLTPTNGLIKIVRY